MLKFFKNNPFATFLLIGFFWLFLQILAEDIKEHISFGMQLFIAGYVVMAIGALGSFIALFTTNSESKA